MVGDLVLWSAVLSLTMRRLADLMRSEPDPGPCRFLSYGVSLYVNSQRVSKSQLPISDGGGNPCVQMPKQLAITVTLNSKPVLWTGTSTGVGRSTLCCSIRIFKKLRL